MIFAHTNLLSSFALVRQYWSTPLHQTKKKIGRGFQWCLAATFLRFPLNPRHTQGHNRAPNHYIPHEQCNLGKVNGPPASNTQTNVSSYKMSQQSKRPPTSKGCCSIGGSPIGNEPFTRLTSFRKIIRFTIFICLLVSLVLLGSPAHQARNILC